MLDPVTMTVSAPEPTATPLPTTAAPTRAATAGIRHAAQQFYAVLPRPSTTPFTFWYLVILAGTTALVDYATPQAVNRLMAEASTSAVNMAHHPVQVLLLSALFLADQHWLAYAAIFTAVLAPLERRIGTKWTVLVFASGHVIATLATELPVLVMVREHLLPRVDAHLLDVGVSYGFFATAGALLLMLPTRPRWWAIGLLNLSILAVYLGMGLTDTDSIVTVLGHTTAAYIGMLGWLPWLRRRGLIGSLRLPSWSRRTPQAALATA